MVRSERAWRSLALAGMLAVYYVDQTTDTALWLNVVGAVVVTVVGTAVSLLTGGSTSQSSGANRTA